MTYQSEKIDQLLKALFAAQAELEHADKSSNNPHFKSKYADLPTVLDTAKPVLQKHGLGIHHFRRCIHEEQHREYLVTRLFHAESGQWTDSVALLNPVKNDPQGVGSAMTYARRYDYQAILGMASDDDDGNAASAPATAPAKDDKAIDTEQAANIDLMLNATKSDKAAFLKFFRVDDVRKLKLKDYQSAITMLNKKAEKAA